MTQPNQILEADQNRIEDFIRTALTTYTEQRVREAVEAERKRLKEKLQDYWVEAALSDQPKDL